MKNNKEDMKSKYSNIIFDSSNEYNDFSKLGFFFSKANRLGCICQDIQKIIKGKIRNTCKMACSYFLPYLINLISICFAYLASIQAYTSLVDQYNCFRCKR